MVAEQFAGLPGYKVVRGFLFPESDRICHPDAINNVRDLDVSINLCRSRGVAVQAGGNCGVWPAYLADRFERVYTFEPDHMNFIALAANTSGKANINRMQAVLGDRPACVAMQQFDGNCGAHRVSGAGTVPTITIDSLALDACDLFCLDIEGMEIEAMTGAMETIKRFRPVIHLEENRCCEAFGHRKGDAEKWLAQFGYKVAARPTHDIVFRAA